MFCFFPSLLDRARVNVSNNQGPGQREACELEAGMLRSSLEAAQGVRAGCEESVNFHVCFGVLSHQTEGSKWA